MLQQFIGLVAALLSVIGLVPYARDVFRKRTRPHLFTWLIWTLMTFIAFAAQVSGGGGAGTWATGVTAVLCLPILGAALFDGERDIKPLDWFSLLVAVIAGLAWMVNDDPTVAVVLVTFIDAIAFIPTIRKSIHKPEQETLSSYVLSASKHTLSIVALSRFSVVTALYPAVVAAMNVVMIALLVVRRAQLPANQQLPVDQLLPTDHLPQAMSPVESPEVL